MIRFTAPASCSFLWQPDSGRWALRAQEGGETAAAVIRTPFVIGRSPDCQLILPESPELAKTTSRWHCHLVEDKERVMIVDGSLTEVPETGQRKLSVSGTFLNGRKINRPEALKHGDQLIVGPWVFGVEEHEEKPVNLDAALKKLSDEKPRKLVSREPHAEQVFARLHGLSLELNRSADAEANLVSILNSALVEIPGAGVAALLVEGPGNSNSARIAWQRGRGRVFDLRFSSDLVRRLPQDRGVLFASKLADPTRSQAQEKISSALLVPLWSRDSRLGILYMDNRGCKAQFSEGDLFLAHAFAGHAALQLLIEKQVYLSKVESSMSRYFGPDVVRLIVEKARAGHSVLPEVKEKTATILFVDLQGFSAFCRGRSPRAICELLSPYLQLAAECIQAHSGHVDKFIGDGVLGVFGAKPVGGAPAEGAHAAQAVRAARRMISSWTKRSESMRSLVLPLRIGINTGPVVVGNIGFPGRMEYGVLGDAVNLASRLEKIAEPNGIALADATKVLLGGEFQCVDAGEIPVKGFGGVRVWRLGA